MEHITGGTRTSAANGEVGSSIRLGAGPRRPSGGDAEFDTPWQRIADVGGQIGSGLERIGRTLDERTGAFTAVRRKPLLALGVAFSAGVVLAAATTFGDRHWAIVRLRKHLRTAVVAGLAAALADEVKDVLENEEGLGHLLHSMLGNDPDEDPELG